MDKTAVTDGTGHIACIAGSAHPMADVLPSDVRMIETIMRVSVDNLCNPELCVPYVLESLCLSRSGLYKRLKNIANSSPGKIILQARISRARQLLAYTDMNSCEIGAAVGVADPAYFSTFFHKYTSMTPLQFRDACEYIPDDDLRLDYFNLVLADGSTVSVRLPDCPASFA